jgi:hypothetical protein
MKLAGRERFSLSELQSAVSEKKCSSMGHSGGSADIVVTASNVKAACAVTTAFRSVHSMFTSSADSICNEGKLVAGQCVNVNTCQLSLTP